MENKINRRAFAVQSGATFLGLAGGLKTLAATPAKGNPLSDKFLAHLPKMMDWSGVPGMQIGVVEKESLIWKGEYGLKNSETKEKVTHETVFPAASLSKPVFAYAVLKLREEGLIDLDRPLINYLPIEYIPNDPRGKTVTARHVLSHSSGLQNWRFGATDKLQLEFNPGERFSYSGEGFFYLQRVVEKITGLGLEQFMRERVFQPFGMKQSSYFWVPEYEKSVTKGHNNRGQVRPTFGAENIQKMVELAAQWNRPLGTWKYEDMEKALPIIDAKMPVFPNFMPMNAAASMQTTVTDYGQFLIKMLNPASGDKFSLKKETWQEMLKPQTKINEVLSWGIGIGLENQNNESYFWHWGDNGNFKAFVLGIPAKKWGIVIFTNGRNGHKIWERVIKEATNQDLASFLWV
jgi:CubicO group peptidase (beta-lactamase class C family)